MATRRYRLYGSFSATANNIDSMVFQRKARVKQIIFGVTFDSITDNGALRVNVSRNAVADFQAGAGGTALPTNAIAQFIQYGNFVTSGLSQPNGNLIVDCNDDFQIGEYLFLNAIVGGTVTASVDIMVVTEEAA